jgi:hypothetical protein
MRKLKVSKTLPSSGSGLKTKGKTIRFLRSGVLSFFMTFSNVFIWLLIVSNRIIRVWFQLFAYFAGNIFTSSKRGNVLPGQI